MREVVFVDCAGKAEVAYFYDSSRWIFRREKEIFRLDVPVHYAQRMAVLNRVNYRSNELFGLLFREGRLLKDRLEQLQCESSINLPRRQS